MLHNLTLNDPTQIELLGHLNVTNRLISKATSNLSGKTVDAVITAMPDLGIAHNITRMMGGFYTGARYEWNCTVPFIPVDTTVNVCGTAFFKIDDDISSLEFLSLAETALSNTSKYSWNYTNGNHFISLVRSYGEFGFEPGLYLLVHASANEYKKMLYPSSEVWYKDDIKVVTDDETGRYLRYISGVPATTFYGIAKMLFHFNVERNKNFAELMLGNKLGKEIVSIQHYGMPNDHTVCIGTHFECKTYPLLTAPGRPVFLVEPDKENFNGTPHGFGLGLKNPKVLYENDCITIGNKTFSGKDAINIGKDALVRCSDAKEDLEAYVSKILDVCPGKIVGKFEQLASISKDGAKIW